MLIPPDGGVDEVLIEDSPETVEGLRRKKRFVFIIDGCWEQINAVIKKLNDDFVKLECEGFKFAAATTMVQQPNDVGRMGLRI